MATENQLWTELLALQEQLRMAEYRLTQLNNKRTELGQTYEVDTPQIQGIDREVRDQVAEVDRLRELVKAKQAAAAALDAAIASNVASGMDTETARIKAVADVQRAEGVKRILTYVGIGLLILLIVLAIYWYRKHKK